ncbi:MAG: hypothetical protein ACOYU3_04870 [Bacillota bacterium]
MKKLFLPLLMLIVLAGCASNNQVQATHDKDMVIIQDFQFQPAEITMK